VNTPKKKFDKEYQRIYASIKDSLSILEVFRVFQPFVALSKIGHCRIDPGILGDTYYGAYMGSGGTVFPINITVQKNKMIILDDYSGSTRIKRGDELVSINGKSAKTLLHAIYSFLSGENEFYINTLVDEFTFPRLDWLIHDPCDSYRVQVKNKNNELITLDLPAIPARKYEDLQGSRNQVDYAGRKFRFMDDIAYLQPGMFLNANGDGNISDVKTHENGEFITFMDSAFAEIHKARSKSLIIDLREIMGGDNTFSDEMLAFIADKPFKFSSRFSVKTSEKTKEFWKQLNDTTLNYLKTPILHTPNGETFEVQVPEHDFRRDSLRFQGKVYVLINRHSYSQTTATAAQIQDYHFGTIIGEKTAELATSYCSIHQFELPNSSLLPCYPKAFTVRPNGNPQFEGVTPDFVIEDNMFTDKDEILDYTLDLIKRETKK
jgi:C-terminal processing protease CtpA/Prc